MSEQLQSFLDKWIPTQIETGLDMHSGDPSSWIAVWSHRDPVSVFGAGVRARSGWDDVLRTITWVASRFGDCTDYDYELVSADVDGDLAYTCGFERYTATRPDGESITNELRVTQIYRREGGAWKLVHRHGDHPPDDPPE
ncbi:YybH family protein [Nocardioides cynanchi]|uniref:YybH family protein n=1 Tax=Nocardioides cynanchi TaxID=2558918 RepID=UPI001243A740|nr:nuclear transport factor 2 family protein [Nocardioides cynanchi]